MPSTPRRAAIVVAAVLPLVPPLTKQGRGAAYFLRAYAGAPVTRTLRFLLASLRKSVRVTP